MIAKREEFLNAEDEFFGILAKLNDKVYVKNYKLFQKKNDEKFKIVVKDFIKIAEHLEDEAHVITDDDMHAKINNFENFRKLVRETNFLLTPIEAYDVIEERLKADFGAAGAEMSLDAPALTKDQSEYRFYYDLVVAALKCGRLDHEIKALKEVPNVDHA